MVCVKPGEASILQFLNFAEAFAVGHNGLEKIFTVLGMHGTLSDLTPDIESSFPHENGSYLRTKLRDVLSRLSDNASATFFAFTNLAKSNALDKAIPKGGIHPLTRLVMNYINILAPYGNSLNTIFREHDQRDDQDSSSLLETSLALENDNVNKISSSSPMGLRFRSLISILESNLENQTRFCREEALVHLSLMNNFHHMGEKVKRSKLKTIFGDDWIREHNGKFQHYAMGYERSMWGPILKLLKYEGVYNPDGSKSKTLLKKRLQMFYTAFEEIYKSQTGWVIPNNELRQDMRISISVKVCQGYRSFIGLNRDYIDEKYIKYSADDLENYLLDLFEGSATSL